MTLAFIDAEKHKNDALVFPAFNLSLIAGEVLAIYSNVNIRSQLMELLLGKSSLSQGEIQLAGQALAQKSVKMGFLFLNDGVYKRLTVLEALRFYKNLHNSPGKVDDILRKVQLELKKNTKLEKLTPSEKRRIQLAALYIQNPDVWVMEEPDQNLDMESKRIFLSLLTELRAAGKTVFILSGNLENAVIAADRVYRLDENGLYQIQTLEEEPEVEEKVEESAAAESIQPIRFEKIPTKVNEKIVLFDPPEIDYIESSEGQSFLYIKGEAFPSYFTLSELEQRLLPYGFFRCHRSYIVNLQKVREVITWTRNSYSLVLEDAKKSSIPLSKSKMAELKGILGMK